MVHRTTKAPTQRPAVKSLFRATLLVGLSSLALAPFATAAETSAAAPAAAATAESFTAQAQRLRAEALLRVEPTGMVPANVTPVATSAYKWKRNIITTTFWVGEQPTKNNPTPNTASSWDQHWTKNYGGYDDPNPANRNGYFPKKFTPKLNPFYFALPYNDTTRGTTKPESRKVIPWFKKEFKKVGQSVCKDRWIAIRHGNRVAYAQWGDCGPFRTDHWQYVFGNERPSMNINKGAGLDVSPAVRDYLRMKPTDVCDWRFVEVSEVPAGPWRQYGTNNPFVKKQATQQVVENDVSTKTGPTVVTSAKPKAKAQASTATSKKPVAQSSD